MTDVFAALHADHAAILGLLTALNDGAGSVGDQRKLATRLVVAESRHEVAEERIVWPLVHERVEGGVALATLALAQEQQGKELLDRFRKASPGEAPFRRLLLEVTRACREHIEFEEERVWPHLRTVLGSEESLALATRVAAVERAAPTRPHPNTPATPPALRTLGALTAAVDRVRDALRHRA